MSHRSISHRSHGDHSRLVTGKRRDALGLVLDAVDAVMEDGIPHPGWTRTDVELRTRALEEAFTEAEAIVSKLRGTGVVPAPMCGFIHRLRFVIWVVNHQSAAALPSSDPETLSEIPANVQ